MNYLPPYPQYNKSIHSSRKPSPALREADLLVRMNGFWFGPPLSTEYEFRLPLALADTGGVAIPTYRCKSAIVFRSITPGL